MKEGRSVTVDDYILSFPLELGKRMVALRKQIKRIAPTALESISYGMPAYKYYGRPLVYFAAYAQHIGLYATPVSHEAFQLDLSKYKQGKSSVQFPLDKELPFDLIERMIRFRMKLIEESGK